MALTDDLTQLGKEIVTTEKLPTSISAISSIPGLMPLHEFDGRES